MAQSISPTPFYPSTQAAEEQSAGVRDPIVDPIVSDSKPVDLTFADVLDILNPLQHIPIVSSLYRALTGDKIAQGPQLAGDLLYGGPAGLLSAGARALFEEAAGVKMDSFVASLVGSEEADAPADPKLAEKAPQVAAAAPAAPAPTAPAAAEPEKPRTNTNAEAMAALARDLRGLSQGVSPEQRAKTHALVPAMPPPVPVPAVGKPPDAAAVKQEARPTETAAASRHPHLPPASGASPQWIAQAMERALVKYHNAARANRPPAPAAQPAVPN